MTELLHQSQSVCRVLFSFILCIIIVGLTFSPVVMCMNSFIFPICRYNMSYKTVYKSGESTQRICITTFTYYEVELFENNLLLLINE